LDVLKTNKSVQYNIMNQNNNRFRKQYNWIFLKQTCLCSTIVLIKTRAVQLDILMIKKSVLYNIIIIIVDFDMAITLESSLLKILILYFLVSSVWEFPEFSNTSAHKCIVRYLPMYIITELQIYRVSHFILDRLKL